jgi:hypothetical protein
MPTLDALFAQSLRPLLGSGRGWSNGPMRGPFPAIREGIVGPSETTDLQSSRNLTLAP